MLCTIIAWGQRSKELYSTWTAQWLIGALMSRALLQSPPASTGPGGCGGLCLQWFIIVIILGCFVFLATFGVILHRMFRTRRALRRGLVPLDLFSRGPGEKLPGERQPYVMARCPVGKEDFRPSECPVCLTEINKRRRWVELRCKHGLCKTCLWRLVRAQGEGAMCPLCRNQLCAYLSEIRAADSTTSGAARAAEPPTPVVGFPVVLAGVEPQPVTEPPAGVRETTEGTGGATSTSTTDICGSRC